MARIARVVVPGYPHHITQRGCRRQQTFYITQDLEYYLRLLTAAKVEAGVAVWSYCLMPNHVHLVVVPETEQSLSKFLAPVHRKYAHPPRNGSGQAPEHTYRARMTASSKFAQCWIGLAIGEVTCLALISGFPMRRYASIAAQGALQEMMNSLVTWKY